MHARCVCMPFYVGKNGAPTYRVLASACNPAPTTPMILKQLGCRVHLQTPPQGGLSCSLLPFAILHNDRVSQQTTAEMDWCRLRVLGACAGRSTKSKGFQQTAHPSHPGRAARSVNICPGQVWAALQTFLLRKVGKIQNSSFSGPSKISGGVAPIVPIIYNKDPAIVEGFVFGKRKNEVRKTS